MKNGRRMRDNMKKLMIILIMILVATSVNAQNLLKIKQMALNEYKSTLYAPSKFILTDYYGNRISVGQLKATYLKEKYDTAKTEKYDCDSVIYYKKTYFPCYEVKIVGEGMVLTGGYKQTTAYYYVYKNEVYSKRPYKKERLFAKKYMGIVLNDKDKSIPFDDTHNTLEQMPSFVGGMPALMDYISNNLRYPIIARENGVQGRVMVSFNIEKDGSITDAEVVKSVDPSLDVEAKRLVEKMPKWIPGKSNGSNVRCKYTIPITFKL